MPRRSLHQSLTVLIPLAAVVACGSGVGPIGLGAIEQRDPPAGTLDDPHATSGNSGGDDDTSQDAGSCACSGTYTCTQSGASVTASFAQSGSCTISVGPASYDWNCAGTVSTGGQKVYTWGGDTTEYDLCPAVDAGAGGCVTCVPTSSTPTDAGN